MAIPISYNIRNLKLRKGLTIMTALGIALTVTTAIFLMALLAGLQRAFVTSGNAQTMPPFIPFIIGEGGQDWPAVAAATTLFFIPILCFTILLRRHLLRGITFGAVRK